MAQKKAARRIGTYETASGSNAPCRIMFTPLICFRSFSSFLHSVLHFCHSSMG